MQILTLVMASMISTHAIAQVKSTRLIIEESRRVLGDGIATDLKPKALEELYRQARVSSWGVKQGFKSGKTIILEQDYKVYPNLSNIPTNIKRKVVLNQSVHYGDVNDTECAVKILQEGTFDTNGGLLQGAGLTHHIEVPNCESNEIKNKTKQRASIVEIGIPYALPINQNFTQPALQASIPEIKPEAKKDCTMERNEKITSLYSSDVALKSLESELQNLKNENNANSINDEKIIANAQIELKNFPNISTSLNQIIAEVYKTRKCPTNEINSWNEFKNLSMNLYLSKEHEKIDMPQILQAEKNPAFWCGYNSSLKEWFTGIFNSKQDLKGIEYIDNLGNVATYTEAENRIYKLTKDLKGSSSYREGGTMGDMTFFKLSKGLYLMGAAKFQDKLKFEARGLYGNYIMFTDEFFEQATTPVIGSNPIQSNLINELTQKIEARKQELDRSVPPCEEKNQWLKPIQSP